MAMDLNAMRDFAAVVDAGGFSAAARALGVPKSTLSARIATLEDCLSSRLIERTTRSLRLTEEGVRIYAHALAIVAEAQEAERAVRDGRAEPAGRLRVSAPYLFGEAALPKVVARYVELYPKASVEVVLSDHRVNLVEAGFDLAIRTGPQSESRLVSRTIAVTRQRFTAAPEIARQIAGESPSTLAEVGCILFAVGNGGAATSWSFLRGEERGEVSVKGRLTFNSLAAVRKAALAGAGVAALPEFLVAEDLASGALVEPFEGWIGAEFPIRTVYPSRRNLNARTRAFVDLLVSAMSPRGFSTLTR
jgi:DNA-binding transcriptional LysR family regulator